MEKEINYLFFYIRENFYERFKHLFKDNEVRQINRVESEDLKEYDYVIAAQPGWYESLDDLEQFLLAQEMEIVSLRLFM